MKGRAWCGLAALAVVPLVTAMGRENTARAANVDPECRECIDWGGHHTFWGNNYCNYQGDPCYKCLDEQCEYESSGPFTCNIHHGVCAETLGQVASAALTAAATVGDLAMLLQLRETSAEIVRVNAGRGVLQVFDCRGSVVAQVEYDGVTDLAGQGDVAPGLEDRL